MTQAKRTALAALLFVAGSLAVMAQNKIYMTKQSGDEFTWKKYTYDFPEDAYMQFEKNRFIIFYPDGTDKRGLYTQIDEFLLKDPGAALYKPSYLRQNDFHEESSRFCFQRSMSSEHFIVFWEAGYGLDPTKAGSRYSFDPAKMLKEAEHVFEVNTQHLGFLAPGQVKPSQEYKIMMFVSYTEEWAAYGSGQDDKVGTLDVNIDAARDLSTCAHEIGHTFQYLIGCELGAANHGWRYGFGSGASGGCAWWEQCAQWQAYRCYPSEKFTDGWSSGVYSNSHLNFLHEDPRYSNYFIQDWWCHLYGEDFIGRLWQEAVKPEDPAETYMRMNNQTQDDFNRDMFGYATHAITWDMDFIREAGKSRWDQFNTSMHHVSDGFLQVDAEYCPQNYGFNVLKLSTPTAGTTVSADFRGIAGAEGYRAVNVDKAGWRYGFVMLQSNGTRIYGDMHSETEGHVEVTVPENVSKMWFVVMGAPTEHWRHPWDDNAANDEQWPYQVKFDGVTYKGITSATSFNFPDDYERNDYEAEIDVDYDLASAETATTTVDIDMYSICMALGLDINNYKGVTPRTENPTEYCVRALQPDGTENDKLISEYAYMWAFNADGTPYEGSLSSETLPCYIMWSNYYQVLYIYMNPIVFESGSTLSPTLVFYYKPAGSEKTYTAKVKVNIHAK